MAGSVRGHLRLRLVAGVGAVATVLAGCGWVLLGGATADDAVADLTTSVSVTGPAAAAGDAVRVAARDPVAVTVGVSGPGQDALAFASFPPAPPRAQQPAARVFDPPGVEPMVVPAPTATSAAGVATGFPRTPQGAVGQWASVLAAGFTGYDPAVMTAVFTEAAVPGQLARADLREQVATATANRTGSGFPPDGPITGVSYEARATMGMVRGVAATGDFVLACVLLRVEWSRATPVAFEVAPVTGCARMWWVPQVGWRVEDAATPDPPLVFPLTQVAFDLGWRELTSAGS